MDEYTTMTKHIAKLAMTPGWLDYARARAKELEAENSRLKRMYADLALENAAIKDVLSRKL